MNDWITQIRARGLDGALRVTLDALEPLGPLGAQVIWVAQPLIGVVGGHTGRSAAAAIAEALETPGGVDDLRRMLE